ncbi:50S ribosome-binding GTPase [Actinomyces bowdenii]|uniref:GTPase n=1 Tax=Actinomyces bowdenii TaxID=131109 RepID=UPI00214AABF6|nr:GTPase [Actinomyces bowdenii]MCR2052250.1 50S ribosome-binding GTPase [Actinomyces bowdenii]
MRIPRTPVPEQGDRGAAAIAAADADLTGDLEALQRAVELAAGLGIDQEDLAPAREVIERAGQRRRLAPQATVVALLGATGSGKSSVFNALAGGELARVAPTRPTTSQPLALIGPGPVVPGATALLDWLEIGQRVQHPGSPGAPALGEGTILLDLPDIDSDEPAHRAVAQRLAGRVDLLVWVLDPEKYADGVVHHDFLAPMAAHAEVTVVALNQVDRLDDQARSAVLEDLARLLAREGMGAAPVMALSARTGEGVAELAGAIASVAQARTATARRLSADIRTAARGLSAGLGLEGPGQPGAPAQCADPSALDDVADLQAAAFRASGAQVVAEAVAGAYRHRARTAVGWLPVRWVERLRRDPLGVLHLGRAGQGGASGQAPGSGGDEGGPLPASSLPQAPAAAAGALRIAAHAYAQRACTGLPSAWAGEAVARSDARAQALAPPLDAAVVATDLEQSRPRWWSAANALQWLTFLTAVVGGLWLVALHLMDRYLLITADPPRWGHVPWPVILLVAGLALGLVLALICGGIARVAASRRSRRARARLRQRISGVIEEHMVAPLRQELASWGELVGLLDRLVQGR